jgi:hypothetical protein
MQPLRCNSNQRSRLECVGTARLARIGRYNGSPVPALLLVLLGAYLLRSLRPLDQRPADSGDSPSHNASEPDKQPIPNLAATITFSKTFDEQYAADQRANHDLQQRGLTVQKLLCFFTACAFGAAVYYAIVANWQTRLLRQQLIGTQAAVLGFISDLGENGLELSIQNRGGVSAQGVILDLTIYERDLPGGADISKSRYRFGPLTLASAPTVGRAPFQQLIILPNWTRSAWQDFLNVKRTVRIEGSLTYENGFGSSLKEDICRSYLGFSLTNAANQQVVFPQFVPCAGFEEAANSAQRRIQEQAERKGKQ